MWTAYASAKVLIFSPAVEFLDWLLRGIRDGGRKALWFAWMMGRRSKEVTYAFDII